jgi:hypothetical protein
MAKKLGLFSAIASVIFALALGLFFRSWLAERTAKAALLLQSEPANSAVSPASPALNNSEEAAPLSSDEITQSNVDEAVQPASDPVQLVQRVNGIDISASHFLKEGDQVFLDVCFDMPNNDDWTVWMASLQAGGEEFTVSGSIPIEVRELPIEGQQRVITFDKRGNWTEKWEPIEAGQKGRRCDTLYFNIRPDLDLSNATIAINSIAAAPREGEECSAAYLNRVQKVLDARKTGIEVQCYKDEIGSGGSSGLKIVSKPDSMSMEDAIAMLYSPEMFLDLHGIRGPWLFNFSQ